MRRGQLVESGLCMAQIQILIVISIMGVIASIANQGFIEPKDRAIPEANFVKLNPLCNGLSHCAASPHDNRYPAGPLGFSDLIATVPECMMPSPWEDAKIVAASFSSLRTETTRKICAAMAKRAETHCVAAPTGIKYS